MGIAGIMQMILRHRKKLGDNSTKRLQEWMKNNPESSTEARFHVLPDFYGSSFQTMRDFRQEEPFLSVATETMATGATLLKWDRLHILYHALRSVRRLFPETPIKVAEVGVYKGGTSFFLCRLLQEFLRPVEGFFSVDTFSGHHQDDVGEGGGDAAHRRGKFGDTNVAAVRRLLDDFEFASVVDKRIQEAPEALSGDVHFLHLDVDLEGPTLWTLKEVVPRMPPGATIVIDDYNRVSCPGIMNAVSSFLEQHDRLCFSLPVPSAQLVIVRI